jgi:Leucine-rich repeat (LRR) protein
LQELKLSFCSSLQSLPSFSTLIHIVDLRIECCDVLKQIPNLGSLSELTSLVIMHCNSLEGMPDGLQQLPHLQRLEVVSCGKLAAWPEMGWDVTGPSRTVIPDPHSFTPEAISYVLSGREWPPAVMALQQLRVANVPCLARLPRSLGLASTLMQLELHKCDALEELPRSLNELVMLTKLEVIDCSKLKALPTTTWDIRELKVLRVKNCDTLTALPDTAARITRPCLERLLLIRCNLTHLPEFVGRLHMLKVLSLCHCGKLESLPWQMKDASRLHTLSLASCTKLSKLPERLPASLELLDLSYCRELASLGESLLSIAHQIGGAQVVLAGWDCLIAEHLPADYVRDVQYTQSLYWPAAEGSEIGEDGISCPVLNLTDHELASVVKAAIRRATVIEKLLADEGFVRDLLTKLSWLATLLASAAFAAGRAPPGGWISGGLPSCSSNTMGEGTCPAGAEGWLRMFSLFDLLTFGTSAALVMFLVACAIPRRDIGDKAAVAGQMSISLLLSA